MWCGLPALCIYLASCTQDQLPQPSEPEECVDITLTYLEDIKPIIDRSCAYSGCHLEATNGSYQDFSGLVTVIESGAFNNRVFQLKDDPTVGMPPNYAPPGRPQDLTPEELEILQCWIANGYPEQ